MKTLFTLSTLFVCLAGASASFAEETSPSASPSRFDLSSLNQGKIAIGVTIKELVATNSTHDLASLVGAQMITYRNYNFYVGGGLNLGALTNGADLGTTIGYGGLLMGWSAPIFSSGFDYDLDLLVGLGGASTGVGITVEPGAYVGKRFAKYFRASVGAGYLFWPVTPAISGGAFSLKIEI